jgi:hypothetical protein
MTAILDSAPEALAYRPTAAEQRAFAEMQARLVALLLRFDEPRFAGRYTARAGQAPPGDASPLQPYRDLAAVMLLRDELFEDILPRVVRRLSFESPHQTIVEEPPPRGRVDWERTFNASLDEWPGELPLRVHTRQRRRDFATPENLLAVAVLLEYRAELLRLLWDDQLVAQGDLLRHPLNAIVAQCERELAFPQFAGIRSAAEQMLDTGAIVDLVERVQERAIPGGNSAYDDLISWRERLLTLPLVQRDPTLPAIPSLGTDPQRDNYLYQLWIFYELADLLRKRDCMRAEDLSLQPMRLRFRWEQCTYELRHDQAVPLPVASWGATDLTTAQPAQGHMVPGVRPDFYLWRVDPAPQQVRDDKILIWREPGVVWDAKYYRERDQAGAPALPIKRMVADLNLLGESRGVLLFAFLKGKHGDHTSYSLAPDPRRDQTLLPGQAVIVRSLCPALPSADSAVHVTLVGLLDDAHRQLAQPRLPRCSGIFLDTLSAVERVAITGRDGTTLGNDFGEILVCPKPHIGPWRVDLVSRTQHCCKEGRVCHIIGQAGARKPVRPPRTAEDLLKELEQLFDSRDLDLLDEESVDAITHRIEELTRQFARITGAFKNLAAYEKQLGDVGFDRTLPLLGAAERESLALAIYLRDQLDHVNASDYSAPVIHVARALECELQQRILAVPGVRASDFPFSKPTLGSLAGVRDRNPSVWRKIHAHLDSAWNGRVDPDDLTFVVRLDHFVDQLDAIVKVRNKAAHTTPVSRELYRQTFRQICGGAGALRVGILNVLLLAWPS